MRVHSGNQIAEHVTPKNNPDLNWSKSPPRFAVTSELIKSDAYRSLSKMESDIWMFALTERRFPSQRGKKKRDIDYWHPSNHRKFILSHKSIRKFFSNKGIKPSSQPTMTKAVTKFMAVGFLSIEKMGGNGAGDMTIYRFENNWRTWNVGDPPCFVRDGLSRKGFCNHKKD